MEKVKPSFRQKLETDFGLRILAVIIAIIIWFVLAITQYPTINKTISGVKVDFSLDGTVAEEKGLSPLNYQDFTVDVEIKGMNYEIGSYTADDITATVDLDSVTKEGTYNLDIEVRSTHSTDRYTVVSISPETVEVQFDRITTQTFPVEVSASYISASEGYTLQSTSCTPSEIDISGAEKDLDNISRVQAVFTESHKLSEDTTLTTNDIVLYDSDDNVLDKSKYQIVDNTYSVLFMIYRKKTANLSVDFSGCPTNFDTSSLPYTISDTPILVLSPNIDDGSTENIKIGSIPLNEIDLARQYTFKLTLAAGEISPDNIEEVTVKFDSNGYTSKTFTIPKNQIVVNNKPSGKTITIDTNQLTNVTIYGPEDVINNLKSTDLIAQIDFSETTISNGSMSKNAVVYSSKYNNIWCYGTNEVQLDIDDE